MEYLYYWIYKYISIKIKMILDAHADSGTNNGIMGDNAIH